MVSFDVLLTLTVAIMHAEFQVKQGALMLLTDTANLSLTS